MAVAPTGLAARHEAERIGVVHGRHHDVLRRRRGQHVGDGVVPPCERVPHAERRVLRVLGERQRREPVGAARRQGEDAELRTTRPSESVPVCSRSG